MVVESAYHQTTGNAVDQQERLLPIEAEAHLREVIAASHTSAANTV